MADLKTKVNKASVEGFFHGIKDTQVREDCQAIADLMQKATKAPRHRRPYSDRSNRTGLEE